MQTSVPSPRVRLEAEFGFPMWRFEGEDSLTFSVPSPVGTRNAVPTMGLRLYCAGPANESRVTWTVLYRWVRAIGSITAEEPFGELDDDLPRRHDIVSTR